MYVYIWEYRVRPESIDSFLEHYSPSGTWVSLFRRARGHVRTELLRDREDPTRFVTIDTWESFELHAEFRRDFGAEFEALDRRCEDMTLSEELVGHFASAARSLGG